MKSDETDRKFLIRAIEVAEEGISNGGGPFGAVIVKDGKIISESYNEVVNSTDPTAHAEILAIRNACRILESHDLTECTLYASCEPCPMCLGAIYWARINSVFYASDRKDAARAGFSDNFIYEELLAEPGIRKISFKTIPGITGDRVFNKWEKLENKKCY